MLGEFITSGLVMVLGYAYPAFECYKAIEKKRTDNEKLRFWCQYWIILAVVTVFGDMLMSWWLPMYNEMKLAFIIYLWYPKTKGTEYVYETMLRPLVAKHEPFVDQNFQELRAKAWDLAIYYWENCSKLGETTFFQMIQYVATQCGKITKSKKKK